MIRNTARGVLLALASVYSAQPAIAQEGKAQGPSSSGYVLTSGQAAAPAAVAPTPASAGGLKAGSEFRDCATCPPMIVVPPGKFVMGSPPNESGRVDNEEPTHAVTIPNAFALGKYEITFDEWDACAADRACARADDSGFGRGRRPVINMSYDSAMKYVTWLSDKTKKQYRLPSEAEWEYAARAGSAEARFWGKSADQACQYANVFNPTTRAKYKDADRGAFACEDGYVETAPVGSFKPNAFGLHDMLGNAWEWVADCWNGTYAGAPTDGSAWATGDCTKRVLRGGGWYFGPRNIRVAKRLKNWATRSGHDLGFRVARTLP